MVRWRENGSNRGRRFDRKSDADAWEREIRRRRQLGPLALAQLTTRGLTLGEWIAERWAPEHAATLEQSTRDRYADAYRLHIEPWLGDLPLTEITVGRLRSWQADRLADGVGVGTIDKARTVLSSVLRHAAESEAIPGNPLTLVRAPLAEHRDSVTPLAPVTVEAVRAVLAGAMDIHVPERIRRGGVRVAGYVVPDERDPLTRQRDATIVSVLAYAGLRPGELRALRWGDIRKATITVERAARPDGTIKSTKNHEPRAVRLLAPLAADLAALRLAAGAPGRRRARAPPDRRAHRRRAPRRRHLDEDRLADVAHGALGPCVRTGRGEDLAASVRPPPQLRLAAARRRPQHPLRRTQTRPLPGAHALDLRPPLRRVRARRSHRRSSRDCAGAENARPRVHRAQGPRRASGSTSGLERQPTRWPT